MLQMHSATKGQRQAVSQLVRSVLLCDMSSFTADRFRDWIKRTDESFNKLGLTLTFKIDDREVNFAIKEVRSKRTVYHFKSSTHVRFGDRDVVMDATQIAGIKM